MANISFGRVIFGGFVLILGISILLQAFGITIPVGVFVGMILILMGIRLIFSRINLNSKEGKQSRCSK